MSQVDVRRALKYPPEVFTGVVVKDLSEGLNDIVVYTGLDVAKLHLTLMGVSSPIADGVSLSVTADGRDGYVTVPDLGAVRGLDYVEPIKVSVVRDLIIRARAISSVSNFVFRYLVRASPIRVVHKLMHGVSLSSSERVLADRLGLQDLILGLPIEPWSPYKGVVDVKYVATKVSASSVVMRVTPPSGYKVVLMDVTVERPSAPNNLIIRVSRDGIEDIMRLDSYGLPTVTAYWGSPNWYSMRVIALDELFVEADVISGGPYKVRVVYGYSPLSVAEKVAWGVELTPNEKVIADRLGIYDKVEAGLLP